jgi:hypothetical protein
MTVQVKYCGGCNPGYDRTELVRRMLEDFSGINIVYEAPPGGTVDFVVVICGCPARCVSHEGLRGLSGKRIVSSPGEYRLLFTDLRDIERNIP